MSGRAAPSPSWRMVSMNDRICPTVNDLPRLGTFCWVDLAARDLDAARRFYGQAFGWAFRNQPTLGGAFTRVSVGGRDFAASMYPLRRAQLEAGVPSHWTPYLRVADTDAAVRRAVAAGGRSVVAPLEVPGVARVALIEDTVGALVGLWQP